MGPFKHTVDDGLDLRKAAFECMYTLLETCLDQLDVFEFLNHIEDGLRDHYDIKVSGCGTAKEGASGCGSDLTVVSGCGTAKKGVSGCGMSK